jgi:signal transduction histidine kinase
MTLTPGARRHIARMKCVIAPSAARLQRPFEALLLREGFDARCCESLLALSPAAAGGLRTVGQFLQQVEREGCRLAKSNVTPAQVAEALDRFATLLDPILAGQFQPAREQLRLATDLALNRAYFQVRETEAQAFYGLYRAEAESRPTDELLRRVVHVLTHAFHARSGRVVLREGLPSELQEPLFIERKTPEERLVLDPAMRGRHACYWSYPLHEAAVFQFGFGLPNRWLPRDLALLKAAVGRCRLQGELRRLEGEARRAEEEERRRLGRELHDETGQSLLLLRLQLELMERDAPESLKRRLAEARGVAEGSISELRRIIAALSPALLERLGLEPALRQLAARFRKLHPCALRARIALPAEPLALPAQEVIYRVVQECFQNIAKHSQATAVNLSVKPADMSIRLSVSDNGAGFSAEIPGKPMSFGLEGMRERAALLGGSLAIRSEPRQGTRITLQLPVSAWMTPNGKDSFTLN